MRPMTAEQARLAENNPLNGKKWLRWGPYLSNRQWGTVREQYNLGPLKKWLNNNDQAWHNLSYPESIKTTYQFGEDGIFGISDEDQYLCFSIGVWNLKDEGEFAGEYSSHIKDRFFGLPGLFGGGEEGSHGEDVKEIYYYKDNTPTHSYMRASYRYPCNPFPYQQILHNNSRHKNSALNEEFELIDTDALSDENYFEIIIEYAKADWNDIVIKIDIINRSASDQEIMIVPYLFFRNTWSWGQETEKPIISLRTDNDSYQWIEAKYRNGQMKYNAPWKLFFDRNESDDFEIIFTENETNPNVIKSDIHLTPSDSEIGIPPPPYKDYISSYLCNANTNKDHDKDSGTKCGLKFIKKKLSASGGCWSIHLRLVEESSATCDYRKDSHGEIIKEMIELRKSEADDFYRQIIPADIDAEAQAIAKQAFATILWNKQFYHFNYLKWNQFRERFVEDATLQQIQIQKTMNQEWSHMQGSRIMTVPDKWEYPYFCSWDSAFHAITLALVDIEYSKETLIQLTQPDIMSPDGQIPGCEFQFSDLNPPIYAWATLKVYETEKKSMGKGDKLFLEKMAWRLWKHYKWWCSHRNQKRHTKGKPIDNNPGAANNIFYKGGFMGFDNISVVNRNHFTGDQVFIEQVDSTAWMALFSLSLMKILVEIGDTGNENQPFITMARTCVTNFIEIERTLNMIGDRRFWPSWDMNDYWYYDILRIELDDAFKLEMPFRIRSLAGLIPLFATDILKGNANNKILRTIAYVIEEKRKLASQTFGDHIHINYVKSTSGEETIIIEFALVNSKKFASIMDRVLSENEFLSKYGIRSLSKFHQSHPFSLDGQIENQYGNVLPIEISYEPGTTNSGIFGSKNSNWRGPIWLPINYMIIEMLHKRQDLTCLEKVSNRPFPTISEDRKNYREIALCLSDRLLRLFRADNISVRPCHSQNDRSLRFYEKDEDARNSILFYEYFDAETGAGLGACHQSWTTLIANLLLDFR